MTLRLAGLAFGGLLLASPAGAADLALKRVMLSSVQAGDALRSRLVQQLTADETRMGELGTAIDAADDAGAKAHQALFDAIGGADTLSPVWSGQATPFCLNQASILAQPALASSGM